MTANIALYAKREDLLHVLRYFGNVKNVKDAINWVEKTKWTAYSAVGIDSDRILVMKPPSGDKLFVYPGEYIIRTASKNFITMPEDQFHLAYRHLEAVI